MERAGARKFGDTIRERRRERNLTQREVARRIGTSSPYVGHLESGTRHPSEDIVTRLADVLGFERRELFFMANPKAKELLHTPQREASTSAWDEFRNNQRTVRNLAVTPEEMDMLGRVALLGQVRSSRDFIYILNTVRQAMTLE